MKNLNTDYAFRKKEAPYCVIWKSDNAFHINFLSAKAETFPSVNFYLDTEEALILFKNNVLQAFEKYMREKRK